MVAEPFIKDLKVFIDDRGVLEQIFNLDLPFELKRIYIIYPRKDIKRGFHGHKIEWKAFFVIKGCVKFIIIEIDNEKNKKTFVLDEKKPQLLIVPNGYYNGMMALENESIILCFSSLNLKESLKDDIRIDPFKFGKEIWEVIDK